MKCKVATLFVLVNLWIFALAFHDNDTADNEEVLREVIQKKESELLTSDLNQQQTHITGSEAKIGEQKWISQLFLEAEHKFDMDEHVSDACKRDFEFYKLHLRNQSVWAVRMMESSEWPTVGIFSGNVEHLGNWDECLYVSSYDIKGQYCLAQASFTLADTLLIPSTNITDKPSEESSVWSAIEMYLKDPVRVDRRKLNWAMCIPSSCKPTDLLLSLNKTVQPIFQNHGINITLNVDPLFCKVGEKENDYPSSYYYVSTIYGVIFSVAMAASVYDIATKNKLKKGKRHTTLEKVFQSFSIVNNFKKLIHYSPNTDYAAIHFAKIANIILIIYGHRFIFFIGYPKATAEHVEEFYKQSSLELIHTNVVDVFFAISGFLSFHFGFLPMLKGGALYLFLNIVFRWIRMVPVFAFLMLFIVYVLPHLGDGPFWDFRIMNEVEKCKSSWWANMLAINNIVKTDQQCLVVSWYISADIQLAILGSILLIIATRNRKIGIYAVVFTFLMVSGITFAVAYINKFHGILRLYMSLLQEPRRSEEFTNFYVATYTRAGPYLMGFFAAFVAKILRERNYTFTTKQLLFFLVMSTLIGEGSQYYGCLFYLFGREYNRTESAIFAAFNRSLFVFPYAVCMCIYFTSGLGFLNKILERRIYVPFGRLTYSVFLVNTIIQLSHASSQRTVMPTALKLNLYWLALADISFSYIFGLLLHLFLEAPIANISKILQSGLTKLFRKTKREDSIAKTDSASTDDNEKSTGCNSKSSTPEMTNGKAHQNGYHNQSYINNEVVPKISESSKI